MEAVKAVAFKHSSDVRPLLQTFNDMVKECIKYALSHNVSSPMKVERALYEEFKQKYGFATHYCISAARVACNVIRSWKRLVKRRRADPNNPPTFNALSMRLQKELMRFKGDRIVITTMPHRYVEVPLIIGSYQKRFIDAWRNGELSLGEVTLLEDRAMVTFKRAVEDKIPIGYASIDVNLMSIDFLKVKGDSAEYRKVDLKKLYGIRVHYFEKRRKIQSLSKHKPITSKRLMQKYSRRERRRVNDILHKITTSIVKELSQEGLAPIFENLKGLSYNATRNKRTKRKNRKVASLPYRKVQSLIGYKMAWLGYKVQYVPARNTSRACPRCGRLSKTNGQVFRCKHCGYEADRHFVACINILRMWGHGFAPKALDEMIEREGLGRGNESNKALRTST
ncbi:MAG: hypothetical protein B9J98_05385 [Candidatus Terraquivivens tikiterensis]|uniref:Cas12f1-like TNB domain-containing protein n=1 Tax=Candidatus Terraquivivens tikiterensis TaxID=1980982 RepID=A0A2R7Y2P9_9ARCH|nr:MAG: hypothetical protein B9J98_05385 [Candidatus Terraquivivens tikiterensis]